MGSVLWAPVLYIVNSWYVLGSILGTHRKTSGIQGPAVLPTKGVYCELSWIAGPCKRLT